MATSEAEAAVIALLEGVGDPELVERSNLFAGPALQPDAGRPARAVFVQLTGGQRDAVFQYDQVQVEVRVDRANYDAGLELALACKDALHCPTTPEGYCDVQVPLGPYFARVDLAGRLVWRLNVTLSRPL